MTDEKDKSEPENLDDLWGQALEEQKVSEGTADASSVETMPATTSAAFKPMQASDSQDASSRELEMIRDIPVDLTVELGSTRVTIKQLLDLAQGSVVELDGLVGEPMDIKINNHLIASGEVVSMDDKYGIRITEIMTASERVRRLAR